MIDLCVGPHIPHTGKIKAFMVTKNSSSYFLGDANNESLQRIYGISFPDKKQLSEYKVFLAEAAKRDHRKIGRDQELFFFHDLSPGSCFFLPHGTKIYNALVDFMREEYFKRGYQEGAFSVQSISLFLLCAQSHRSHLAQHVQLKTLGDLWSLAELQG